jgi:hypothetical protein
MRFRMQRPELFGSVVYHDQKAEIQSAVCGTL